MPAMSTPSRASALLVMLLYSSTLTAAEMVASHVPPMNHSGVRAQHPMLHWRPGKTTPARRLVPVRWNYIKPEACEPWVDCVHKHRLLHTLKSSPWPPGTSVLFLGNSYVRQLGETAVLDVPDSAIRSMHFPGRGCSCPLTAHGNGHQCVMQDFLSFAPQDERGALRINGVQYCDGWNHNGTTLAKYNDTAQIRFCSDDRMVVRLHEGTILAQVSNHQALFKLPLEDGVMYATGIPLSAFDVVIANQANPIQHYRGRYCKGDMGDLLSRPDGTRGMPVRDTLAVLERAGFRGHLYMVSDDMWQPVTPEVEQAVSAAMATGLSYNAHVSNVLVGSRYEVVRTCGAAKSQASHACMPGPVHWMMQALRSEYAAVAGSRR